MNKTILNNTISYLYREKRKLSELKRNTGYLTPKEQQELVLLEYLIDTLESLEDLFIKNPKRIQSDNNN